MFIQIDGSHQTQVLGSLWAVEYHLLFALIVFGKLGVDFF